MPSSFFPNSNPLGYVGTNEVNAPELYFFTKDPTTNDYKNFELGDIWINKTTSKVFIFTKKALNVATWTLLGAGTSSDLDSLTGDSGGTITPDTAYNINLLGTAVQGISTSGSGNTITWTIADATTTQKGVSELATDAEAIAGSLTTNVVLNPSSLKAKLGTQTVHGVALGGGNTAALSYTSAGSVGQILRSAGASADPDWTTWTIGATTAQGDILYSSAANTISSLAKDTNATRYLSNTGSSNNPAWAQVNLTNGVTGTLPVTNGGTGVASITDHALIVGSGTAAITEIGPLTNGQLVIGSTGADPVAATLTTPLSTIDITNGAGSIGLDVNASNRTDTGFASWSAAGPYFDDTTLGTFTVLVGGTGYINNKLITWSGPQSVTGLTAGNTYYIYIDSTGTIGSTTTRTNALYQDYIVLFECLRDSTLPTNNQVTTKENHPYTFPVNTSNYLHEVIGVVIENFNNGANITLNGTQKIQINGTDYLNDHGLITTIPDSGGVAVSWIRMYTDGSGKWARFNSSDTFTGYYNNAGTPTALGASKYAVYRLYCTKDNLNVSTPVYGAILDTTQYNNLASAQTAIANGTIASATNEIYNLEIVQLGYIIYSQASSSIVDVIIDKTTQISTTSTSGTNVASLVTTVTSNFDGWLSSADTNVQAALETLDDVGKGVTPQHSVLLAGASYAITSTGVLTNGQLVIGNTGSAPSVASLTAGSGISIVGGAGSITIASTGSGMAYSEVTGATQAMAANTAYGANNAGGVTFTLPSTASAGTVMQITGILGNWVLAQNAGQTVYIGNTNTTTGAGGSLTAADKGDCITLRCIVANTDFRVESMMGNITVA